MTSDRSTKIRQARELMAPSQVIEAHSGEDDLFAFYRTENGAWHAWCPQHDWEAGGPLRYAGEQMGNHIRDEHDANRIEDMKDLAVSTMYGLNGLSWDPAGNGVREPARRNRS